jgi:hypothetical protein
MASAKDTFEANTFEGNTFACGTWRGLGVAAAVTGPLSPMIRRVSETGTKLRRTTTADATQLRKVSETEPTELRRVSE